MRLLFGGIALLFCASHVFAAPVTHREKINGFQVDFVDVGAGDRMAVTFYLPVGALHNRGRTLGLAHMFEHYIHNGSVALPGHHSMKNLMARIGANTNATTDLEHTSFFAEAGQADAKVLLHARLGMLGGLEWNEETFELERTAVIDEVSTEGMKQDLYAFKQMIHTRLLPEGHAWARPLQGDKESLLKLNLDDLREYYYANYRPEYVKIAIHGNFSDPKFLADVRAWTREYLKPASSSEDAKKWANPVAPLPAVMPASYFQSGAPATAAKRVLYVNSDKLRAQKVLFEATRGFPAEKWHIADLIARYMNLTIPGSLLHALTTEKQWITDGSFYSYHLNNRPYLSFLVTPSEEGSRHVDQINAMMMRLLRSLQTHGIPAKMLAMLKSDEIYNWKMSGNSVGELRKRYLTIMDESSTLDSQLDKISSITNAEIKDFMKRFDPGHALYAVMGAETEAMLSDPDYNRGYRILENSALPEYKKIFSDEAAAFEPPLPDFNLALPAPAPFHKKFAQSKPDPDLNERLIVDFRQDLPNIAANVGLKFAARSGEELVYLDLLIAAFSERYSEAMFNAKLRYQAIGFVTRIGNTLWFKGGGDSRNSVSYVQWLMKALSEFVPTVDELERARRASLSAAAGNYSGAYSASLAMETNSASLDPLRFTNAQAWQWLKTMDFQQAQERWSELKSRADRTFVLAGDLRDADYDSLKKAAAQFSALPLSPGDRADLAGRFLFTDGEHAASWPLAGRAAGGFGFTRTYLGPSAANLRESVAFAVLSSLWNTQIGIRNRGEQGLGYMHGAYSASLDLRNFMLVLYGQSDSSEKVNRAIEGWGYVMSGIVNGSTSDEAIQGAIHATTQIYSTKQIEASALADVYATQMELRFDGRARQKLVTELSTLTAAEVREVARKYILHDGVKYQQSIFGSADCDAALTSGK